MRGHGAPDSMNFSSRDADFLSALDFLGKPKRLIMFQPFWLTGSAQRDEILITELKFSIHCGRLTPFSGIR